MIPPFYFRTGQVANNILEMREILNQLSPEDASHYINEDKNDVANWVENGLQDPELAERLKNIMSPTETIAVLNNVLGAQDDDEDSGNDNPEIIPNDAYENACDDEDSIDDVPDNVPEGDVQEAAASMLLELPDLDDPDDPTIDPLQGPQADYGLEPREPNLEDVFEPEMPHKDFDPVAPEPLQEEPGSEPDDEGDGNEGMPPFEPMSDDPGLLAPHIVYPPNDLAHAGSHQGTNHTMEEDGDTAVINPEDYKPETDHAEKPETNPADYKDPANKEIEAHMDELTGVGAGSEAHAAAGTATKSKKMSMGTKILIFGGVLIVLAAVAWWLITIFS